MLSDLVRESCRIRIAWAQKLASKDVMFEERPDLVDRSLSRSLFFSLGSWTRFVLSGFCVKSRSD